MDEGGRGVRVALGCLQRRAGKQEVADVCSRVAATRASSWREEDDRGGGQVGWAGTGPGQVGCTVLGLEAVGKHRCFFYHFFFFSIYLPFVLI